VDWVAKNLYWIETSDRIKVIKVATLDGKNIRTLVKLETDRKPQNIVLDPQSRYDKHLLLCKLFFSYWSNLNFHKLKFNYFFELVYFLTLYDF